MKAAIVCAAGSKTWRNAPPACVGRSLGISHVPSRSRQALCPKAVISTGMASPLCWRGQAHGEYNREEKSTSKTCATSVASLMMARIPGLPPQDAATWQPPTCTRSPPPQAGGHLDERQALFHQLAPGHLYQARASGPSRCSPFAASGAWAPARPTGKITIRSAEGLHHAYSEVRAVELHAIRRRSRGAVWGKG